MACYLDNPHQSVTKELYPAVAKKTGVSAQAVEKAIRTEITRAWSCRNDTIWRTYFHWDRCGTIPRPTNATFFAQLALHLAQQCVKIV